VTYVVVARWVAETGNEEGVAASIKKLIGPSRNEPGCLQYLANRSLTDSRVFLLYEEYLDEAAYTAHVDSDHFVRYALGEGIPLLESREREFYATLDASGSEY
jgi:quinol monooxygenase YgiN